MGQGEGIRGAAIPVLAEVFREYGYEGASLALLGARAGLGKGSLYHAFPGGKAEMAEAVLAAIEGWFETRIYAPLRTDADPRAAIARMLSETDTYFRSGGRACLVGAFALTDGRDRFAARIAGYFKAWREALAQALLRVGHGPEAADDLAEEAVAAIQGGLVLARALDEPAAFGRMLGRLRPRLLPDP
ncbi:TetR family transcriptional regulator [Methylobacterium sp. Leaf104]|uniref:TetR/AcrR family transcriptional regulator n=1 Tax=Methylobacterium TaxID=407 RepID=UPI0006FFE9CB|nr:MULTISPECIES: TetR/AcrR family transcriptional regulator [Methylobacterium]KQP30488.1 TetR family transcriptional regulator [Methylobacterium sp. Leaf104]MCI9882135.1 TetR/AcrR family transcriptional regulator [Methylobacterium goesingense]